MWFSLSLDGRAKLNSSDTSESYGSPHGRDNTLFLFVSMSHYFTMFISIFIHLSLYPSQCPFRPAGALYSVSSFFVKNLFLFYSIPYVLCYLVDSRQVFVQFSYLSLVRRLLPLSDSMCLADFLPICCSLPLYRKLLIFCLRAASLLVLLGRYSRQSHLFFRFALIQAYLSLSLCGCTYISIQILVSIYDVLRFNLSFVLFTFIKNIYFIGLS